MAANVGINPIDSLHFNSDGYDEDEGDGADGQGLRSGNGDDDDMITRTTMTLNPVATVVARLIEPS